MSSIVHTGMTPYEAIQIEVNLWFYRPINIIYTFVTSTTFKLVAKSQNLLTITEAMVLMIFTANASCLAINVI